MSEPRWEWSEWDNWYEDSTLAYEPMPAEVMAGYLNALETRLQSALTKLREIAKGHAGNPQKAAADFIKELNGHGV